jgi:cell division protein FtsQ
VALVDAGGVSLWLIDASGVILEQHTPDATLTVTVVRDVEGLDPIPGRKTLSEPLLNAIDVLEGLSPELRSMVRAISAPSIDKTSLITHEDIEIFIGSVDDLDKKDRVARQILEEQAGDVVYINVRTVDRPTWRGLGDE